MRSASFPEMNYSETGGAMLAPEVAAVEILRCALGWEPEARILENVRACEVARLAANAIMTCPACGAEAWVNIDCETCLVVGKLVSGEIP